MKLNPELQKVPFGEFDSEWVAFVKFGDLIKCDNCGEDIITDCIFCFNTGKKYCKESCTKTNNARFNLCKEQKIQEHIHGKVKLKNLNVRR